MRRFPHDKRTHPYPSRLSAKTAFGPTQTSPFIRGVKWTPRKGNLGSGTLGGKDYCSHLLLLFLLAHRLPLGALGWRRGFFIIRNLIIPLCLPQLHLLHLHCLHQLFLYLLPLALLHCRRSLTHREALQGYIEVFKSAICQPSVHYSFGWLLRHIRQCLQYVFAAKSSKKCTRDDELIIPKLNSFSNSKTNCS